MLVRFADRILVQIFLVAAAACTVAGSIQKSSGLWGFKRLALASSDMLVGDAPPTTSLATLSRTSPDISGLG